MLSEAFASATKYTRPLIMLKRLHGGEVVAGMGTFFLVNPEGWAITAAHVLKDYLQANVDRVEIEVYKQACARIDQDSSLTEGKKRHQRNQLHQKSDWVTNLSPWFGANGVDIEGQIHFDQMADLACFRLKNTEALNVTGFPVFAGPAKTLMQGMTMCRLGFPFSEISATFDTNTQKFDVPPIAAIPMFPNEGILTRTQIMRDEVANRDVLFIETSNPGLRGQSGGPIFDRFGIVWAVQSSTSSLPLGFAPIAMQGSKKVIEHQFIHVGRGAHVQHIVELMRQRNVAFQVADSIPCGV